MYSSNNTSYPPISVLSSQLVIESKSTSNSDYILVALGIIVLIGALAATGLLFPQIGYSSLAIGVGGIVFGVGCFLINRYLHKRPIQDPQQALQEENSIIVNNEADDLSPALTIQKKIPSTISSKKASITPKKSKNAFRAQIFKETLAACKSGNYLHNKTTIKIDNDPMLQGTESYTQPDPVDVENTYETKFCVTIDDTLNVLLKLKKAGADPVGINMANRVHVGGGVENGCPAQEEALCRRSNHILGLQSQKYPFPENGGIYCPHVQVFRNDEAHGFAFMEEPEEVALVAIAAYDLKSGSKDRIKLHLPPLGSIKESSLYKNARYTTKTKAKIRNMLRTMALKGHTHIVLGALGCGAFHNPPKIISKLFQEVFNEEEFKGIFEEVHFAILKISASDQANIEAFSHICEELNSSPESDTEH